MFHPHDCDAPAARPVGPRVAHDGDQFGDFEVGQARRDLIEQEQVRPRGKGTRQLETLALEQVQPSRRAVGVGCQPSVLQDRESPLVGAPACRPAPACAANSTFSNTRLLLERARHLVSPADPEPAARGRVQAVHHAPFEDHLPPVGGEVPGDDAEDAGLAGPVGPTTPRSSSAPTTSESSSAT